MRRISPGTVSVGVFSILLGLVTVYVARRALEPKPRPVPEVAGVPMVVPLVNLPANTRIRIQDLQTVNVPEKSIPEGALRRAAVAANRFVKTTIPAGQPIMETYLFAIGETPSLADRLPPGYRALTISVTGNNNTDPLIQAGVYVDVAVTVEKELPGLGPFGGTVTLLKNVHVLAVGAPVTRQTTSRPPLSELTVAVTPEQANKLIVAQHHGTMSVSLCSAQEQSPTDDTASQIISLNDVLGVEPPVVEEPYTVEHYVGGELRVLTISPRRVQEAKDATAADSRRQSGQAVPHMTNKPIQPGTAATGWATGTTTTALPTGVPMLSPPTPRPVLPLPLPNTAPLQPPKSSAQPSGFLPPVPLSPGTGQPPPPPAPQSTPYDFDAPPVPKVTPSFSSPPPEEGVQSRIQNRLYGSAATVPASSSGVTPATVAPLTAQPAAVSPRMTATPAVTPAPTASRIFVIAHPPR